MPSSVNPKKQSLMPAGKLRKALRAAGHRLSPVVQVGKEGVTAAVLAQLDEALLAHELVKVKVGSQGPEDRFEAASRLAGLPGAQVAQVLGRTALVYRKHPKKPKFEKGPRVAGEKPPPARRTPPKPRRASGTTRRSPGTKRSPGTRQPGTRRSPGTKQPGRG